MHSFIIAITTFTAYLLILTIDIVPYQLENHLLIVILSIESIVSIHSLQLYVCDTKDVCSQQDPDEIFHETSEAEPK